MSVRIPVAVLFSSLTLAAGFTLPAELDETYYWTWSRSLAWSYADHPPAIAAVLAASRGIFGDGLFALRAPSLLAMVVVLAASTASAARLVSHPLRARARLLAALSLSGSAMFLLGYLPGTPDPLQGAASAVSAYLVVRSFDPGARARWPFFAGFALVAATWFKHSSAILAAGALAGALASREGRSLLARGAPWLGAALGLACLLPWCIDDLGRVDGATAFQAARVLEAHAPRGPIAIPLAAGSMMLTLGPAAGLAVFAAPLLVLYAAGSERVLLTGASALVLACVVAAWLGTGEANWPMPALVFALPAVVSRVVAQGGRTERVYTLSAAIASFAVALLLAHVVSPYIPIPPRKDRTLRAAGFDAIASIVEDTARAHGAELIITRRYQLASELRYHLRDAWPVLELGTERRSQYDRWPRPRLCAGDVAVVVLPGAALPDVPLEPLAPARAVRRGRGTVELDTYFVSPVRATASAKGCPPAAPRSWP